MDVVVGEVVGDRVDDGLQDLAAAGLEGGRGCLVWESESMKFISMRWCISYSTHVVKVNLFLAQSGKLCASGLHVEGGRRHGY